MLDASTEDPFFRRVLHRLQPKPGQKGLRDAARQENRANPPHGERSLDAGKHGCDANVCVHRLQAASTLNKLARKTTLNVYLTFNSIHSIRKGSSPGGEGA
jgi:hypothetical protein